MTDGAPGQPVIDAPAACPRCGSYKVCFHDSSLHCGTDDQDPPAGCGWHQPVDVPNGPFIIRTVYAPDPED